MQWTTRVCDGLRFLRLVARFWTIGMVAPGLVTAAVTWIA